MKKELACKKCGSSNVQYQLQNEVKLKNKHHGLVYWFCFGWLWSMFKWLFLTIPTLIFAIFGNKKQKAVNKKVMHAICQDCGHSWRAK